MSNDIAIIGLAGLFPGAKDIHAYWYNIINKVDNIKEAPDDWAVPYFDPNSQPREDPARIYTRKVGLLGELAEFNPLEFGIPPSSVEGDPSHFLALKMARDALKDAGYLDKSFNREKAGIILGRGSNPNRGDVGGIQHGVILDQTVDLIAQILPQLDKETLQSLRRELQKSLPSTEIEKAPTLVSNVASGRIANRLDLMGPNYLIDAACASASIAVQLGAEELLKERCDLILAGGVQASMPPVIYQLFCQLNALSRTQIRPFDRSASGTLLSEGVGFLVLKRLVDAQRDGDRIYAVVKGVGVSSDGKALGLLAPRLEGEILAIERAYQQTGIPRSTIDLIEAHGTGIPLGDETEIKSLTHVFGAREGKMPKIALGSVKSSIGHCIPASGVASLIKISLALYYKTLPPTLCDEVNPALEIEKTPFYINNEARPWIHTGASPRHAAINAFGFGGINTHVILEEYVPERSIPSATELPLYLTPAAVISDWPSELLVFSGDRIETLIASIELVQKYIQLSPEVKLADLAYTLSLKKPENRRLAIIAKDIADLQPKLELAISKLKESKPVKIQPRSGIYYADKEVEAGQIAFMFPTEGSQYANMLADVCTYFPQVREWFDFLNETFVRENPPSQLIFPPPTGMTEAESKWAADQLFAGDVATESLFAASLGMYELLRDLGIKCDILLGHSAGEHIAATASGISKVTSREQIMEHLRHLNQIYQNWEGKDKIPTGVLYSVGALDLAQVRETIESFPGSVYLVADNCPNQILLFAKPEVSEAVAERLKQAGGIAVPQPFDRAYHTPLFEEAGEALAEHYNLIEVNDKINVCLYSCATTEPYPTDPEAAKTLALRQWYMPVLFRQTIEKLYQNGVRTFIEVGAGSNLTSFVEIILKGRDFLAVASNNSKQSGLKQIQQMLARLFINSREVNLTKLFQHRQVQELDLETPATKPTKPTPVLNLLLPKMSLKEEFVAQIQEKLKSHLTSSTAQRSPSVAPVEPGDRSSTNLQQTPQLKEVNLENERSKERDNQKQQIQEFELQASNLNYATNPTSTDELLMSEVMSEETRLALLEGHFSLMQEFLENQEKVTNMMFSE
jgi:acyl transferase domain-containing protein